MKIILTGSTGFIGAEVLRQCLRDPSITSVIALSRRELSAKHEKLKTVLVKDFAAIDTDESVLEELQGAVGCVWSLGVAMANMEIQREVTIRYTLSALRAFSKLKAPPASPFRLVFVSGFLAERSQARSLWFIPAMRHIKGQAETEVLNCEDSSSSSSTTGNKNAGGGGVDVDRSYRPFEGFVARPGAVFDAERRGVGAAAAGVIRLVGMPVVSSQALAAAMIELALGRGGRGGGGEGDGGTGTSGVDRIWENQALAVRGAEILERRAKVGAKEKEKGKNGEL